MVVVVVEVVEVVVVADVVVVAALIVVPGPFCSRSNSSGIEVVVQ